MKKRTVITTEMSEVWIIHQAPEGTVETTDYVHQPPSISNLLLKPIDQEFEENTDNPQEPSSPTSEPGK